MIASVLPDIEPFIILVFDLAYPLHGFFHSFSGGTIIASIISIAVYFFRNEMNKMMKFFKLSQVSSFKKIFWTSLFGVYFHILLDSFLYADIRPLYPHGYNPFYGMFSPESVYLFSGISFFIAIYFFRPQPSHP